MNCLKNSMTFWHFHRKFLLDQNILADSPCLITLHNGAGNWQLTTTRQEMLQAILIWSFQLDPLQR